MLVEYFGLSGSGKSYLSRKQSKEEGIPIVEINGRQEKLFCVLSFAFVHPIFFLKTTGKIVVESKGSFRLWRHKYFSLFLLAIAREYKAQKMRDAIITDGLFQFGLSLFEEKTKESEMGTYVNQLAKFPERTLYLVEAEEHVRIQRMQDRKRIPRSKFGQEYVQNFQEVLKYNMEILKKVTRDRITVVENNTNT